ncbi:hypothetical protein KUCAC02_016743, partial [Chaenocephalus aceratus]
TTEPTDIRCLCVRGLPIILGAFCLLHDLHRDGCLRRERYGHYSTLLNELKTEDEKAFFNYTSPRGLYDEVLRRVEGRIEKKDTWYRKSLPPGLKLSITPRHLACGDNYPSLSYNFRVAPNTVSLIINEVCDAIKAEVIQCPTTTEEWTATAEQFEKRCHTAVVLWMASMWRSPVLGILALKVHPYRKGSFLCIKKEDSVECGHIELMLMKENKYVLSGDTTRLILSYLAEYGLSNVGEAARHMSWVTWLIHNGSASRLWMQPIVDVLDNLGVTSVQDLNGVEVDDLGGDNISSEMAGCSSVASTSYTGSHASSVCIPVSPRPFSSGRRESPMAASAVMAAEDQVVVHDRIFTFTEA